MRANARLLQSALAAVFTACVTLFVTYLWYAVDLRDIGLTIGAARWGLAAVAQLPALLTLSFLEAYRHGR